jgi:hypothetical protein
VNINLGTYRSVGYIALAPRERLESLGLVAHGALDLDDLVAASALLALRKVRVADIVLDLVAVVGQLLVRVPREHEVLAATIALNLGRKRNATVESVRLLAMTKQRGVGLKLTCPSPLEPRRACDLWP